MRVQRQNGPLVVTLNLFESRVLLRVFQALAASYKLRPGDLDLKVASAWYSTRGCVTAKMSAAETQEWLEHLHTIKGRRLVRLEGWLRQLAGTEIGEHRMLVELEEADAFLTTLNDYRLMMAARHDIGQDEMDLRAPEEWSSLLPARQSALFEIHFLAWMLEETLRELPEG